MIARPYFILQVEENGNWHGLQNFVDAERGAKTLAEVEAEDPAGSYRLDDRSYEVPDRYEA